MPIAQLSIDLVAKLASFETDMRKAAESAERTASRMESAFGLAGAAARGLLSALSVRAMVQFFSATVDGVDKLNDLADATGTTVEKLSALEDIGARTGTAVDVVADAVGKLNKVLSEALPGSQQAASLKAIGLSADELRKLDPADALHKVARALAQFADDGSKARLVQDLLGKSYREIAPYLKDLAEAGELNAKVTTEQAKQAEAFNKEMFALQKNVQDAARAIVGDMLPALSEAAKLFTLLIQGPGLGSAMLEVLKGNSFREAGEGVAFYSKKLEELNKERDEFANAKSNSPARLQGLADIDAQIAKVRQFKNIFEQLQASAAPKADYSNEGRLPTSRPSIGDGFKVDPKALAEAERAAKQYEKLAASVGLAASAASLEIQGADRLSELQALRIKLLEELNNGETKFSAAQRASLAAIVDSLGPLDKELQLKRAKLSVESHSTQLTNQLLDTLNREREARAGLNQATREQIEEFGLTAEAVEQLRIKRLEEAAAQEEQLLITLRNVEGTEQEVAARELNAAALRDQISLRQKLSRLDSNARTDPVAGAQRALDRYVEQLREAGVETERAVAQGFSTLEDDLTQSLAKGKFSVRNFVDFTLQELIRLKVVRPFLSEMFGGDSAAGWLKALFGSGITVDTSGAGTPSDPVFGRPRGGAATGSNYIERDMLTLLHEGEAVIPKAYNPAAGGAAPNVTVNVHNAPNGVESQSVRQTPSGTVIDVVLAAVEQDVRAGGKISRAIGSTYGVNRGPGTRRKG